MYSLFKHPSKVIIKYVEDKIEETKGLILVFHAVTGEDVLAVYTEKILAHNEIRPKGVKDLSILESSRTN